MSEFDAMMLCVLAGVALGVIWRGSWDKKRDVAALEDEDA